MGLPGGYLTSSVCDEDKPINTWKDAPQGRIQKFDVAVARSYLTENDMAQLQRLVSAYLDVAEDMALRHIAMTMQDWETRLNRFIAATRGDFAGCWQGHRRNRPSPRRK